MTVPAPNPQPSSTEYETLPTPEPLVWCRSCSVNLTVTWADHGVWNCTCPSCGAHVQVVF